MELKNLNLDFSVCKLEDLEAVDLTKDFCFVGKTDEEISLVCQTGDVPDHVLQREDGWRALRVQGALDFSLIGVLSELSGILAGNGISIFALSTFDTDYLLVKSEKFQAAVEALAKAGHQVMP